ncbi:MAG: type II toxin-antitoxin system RelE/ParE family toxin [bacterium]|nr:type II toxin-antitoxin system RelE/ParE family toxin [bacterium]
MKGRVTGTAFNELLEIHSYIAKEDDAAARLVRSRVEELIERIFEFPFIAPAVNDVGVRVFPVRPFPYLIFYTVTQREVIIRNVRYAGRMRP